MYEQTRRTLFYSRRIVGLAFSLAALSFLLSWTTESSAAQGERERGKRLARVIQAPEALASQTLRPVVDAVASVPGMRNSFVSSDDYDARAIYHVDIRNVSWRSREGKSYEATIYHPTSRPIAGSSFSAVVYSPGLGAAPENFKYLALSWASRGVVCVMLHHPESDDKLWRGKVRPMANVKEAYQHYWTGRDRAMAIRSAIDLIYYPLGDVQSIFENVNRRKIAVAGNDLGALGALLVAGQLPPDNGPSLYDERVSAVLAMSPPVFCEAEQGPEVYAYVSVPLMVVTGTKDDGIVGSTKAYQRRVPYDSVRFSDRYLVVLEGGDHRVYGGHNVGKQNSDAMYQDTIRIATSDFLSAYLQDDYSTLMNMRQVGSSMGLNNAIVEKRLMPLTLDSVSAASGNSSMRIEY